MCYLPDAVPIEELEGVILDSEKISTVYNMATLKVFLIHLNIRNKVTPLELLRKSILKWIKNNEINQKLTIDNYNPVVDYFASQYYRIENKLRESEVSDMKKMPVLTCAQIFKKAEVCYFDSSVPDVPGFEHLIAEDFLVRTESIPKHVVDFLQKIGVTINMKPIDVLRRSVLKWIREGTIKEKINLKNHQSILEYIAENWETPGIKPIEKEQFKNFPILTINKSFKEACHCYWRTDDSNCWEKIPDVESIISYSDFVSLQYTSQKIKNLLDNFGVRSLKFADVCETYCNHLNKWKNIEWFFFHLTKYWENKPPDGTRILNSIKEKLKESLLLGRNGDMYRPTELYSLRFSPIHSIDPRSLPLLHLKKMSEELEKFLGFKNKLEMPCIVKLLEAFGIKQRNQTINEQETFDFFTILLEQLKYKNKNEIKRHTLKLLSEANELKLAEELYYFIGEDDTCSLKEHYLKRICKMSHDETLKLAELCGVNVLPFNVEVRFKEAKDSSTLKEFYLERLPFIILRESKKRNENPSTILKKLYNLVCSIELFECQEITVKYPFGEAVNERRHFDIFKFYVIDDWKDYSSLIHKHIKEKFCIEADIDDIIDIRSFSQKKIEEWLQYEREDRQKFCQIEKELQNLVLGQASQSTVVKEFLDTETDGPNTSFESDDAKNEQNIYDTILPTGQEEKTAANKQPPYLKIIGGDTDSSRVGQPNTWNTLKEFYIKRLPYIVVLESKYLHQSPYVILKRIYDSVLSIELIQENFVDRKSSCNIPINANYYFHGLKFYVRGNWKDYKTAIHQHIVKELCLNSDVNDIDMESITENNKDWIRFREENSETFNLIEEELRKLLQDRTYLSNKETSACHETRNGRLRADSATDNEFKDGIHRKQSTENTDRKQQTINSNSGVYGAVGDDLNLRESRIHSKRSVVDKDISGTLTENFPSESIPVFSGFVTDKSRMQRFGESYVFKFLQYHYKNKYQNANCNLFNGYFKLQWQSHVINIIWLNESNDKEQPYDIKLKKNGEVKQFIEVRCTNKKISNFFTINHRVFLRDQIIVEPEEAKYCIYYVFNIEDSSSATVEQAGGCFALYKVVPLEIPRNRMTFTPT